MLRAASACDRAAHPWPDRRPAAPRQLVVWTLTGGVVSQYVGGFDESFFCLATRLGRGDYPLSLELPALCLRGAWIPQGIDCRRR